MLISTALLLDSNIRNSVCTPAKLPCRRVKLLSERVLTYLVVEKIVYSAFFLTVAIGNCMVKLIPPVNFCSDENIQTIFGTKFEDFLNYRINNNSIS
jgi:hypothetical protein